MENLLYGRELLLNELPQEIRTQIEAKERTVECTNSYRQKKNLFFCARCQSAMTPVSAAECICHEACAYCRNCIQMGKVRKCSNFYSMPEVNQFRPPVGKLLAWQGQLSEQQQLASTAIIEAIEKKATHLLWAVAGAGKTEMLFQGIEQSLKQNERICIASPRVDVCLELAPRLQAAFPTIPLTVLHGAMEKDYEYTQLTIATTHQLYRFKEAFDLLIIDEIDAFPFEMDPGLQFAANKARKKKSALIYLSATPNRTMQKEVKQGKLKATILPARYHGYPLPVPQTRWCVDWQVNILKKLNKTTFGKEFHQRVASKKRFLVFAPNIQWMGALEQVIRQTYPDTAFESVSAEDPKRKEKVLKMRTEDVQFLVTTTILERGVTFPNIDVLVIGAEDRIYTEAALVQIAGRCGRSFEYPTGEVIFFHDGKTIAIKRAIKQITQMNRRARSQGLIQ